jgi:hypothetical protein
MPAPRYEESVFINCPFDTKYGALLDALVFAVHDCGFVARCAQEIRDTGQVRIDKIVKLVEQCKFGIHDISRTEPDRQSGLPRFNMPLELGIFLGAKAFGDRRQKQKVCLVLDKEPYRYQKFCSDIAGQDPSAHNNDPAAAITVVRDWLRTHTRFIIPSGSKIVERYAQFRKALPAMCKKVDLEPGKLIFNDYTTLVVEWLKENSRVK